MCVCACVCVFDMCQCSMHVHVCVVYVGGGRGRKYTCTARVEGKLDHFQYASHHCDVIGSGLYLNYILTSKYAFPYVLPEGFKGLLALG